MMMTNVSRSFSMAIASALGTTLVAPSAPACGGFFCSQSAPIVQAAERIIFAQDGDHVTQIVEVAYDGPSEKFSWVLPVPGIPIPGVSSKTAFDRLDQATAPTYQLQLDFACTPFGAGALNFDSAGGDPEAVPLVSILDSGTVGPFDYQTISVNAADEPAEVAINWLTENGYDVTDKTGEVLGPYLANGLNLIAFRLTKGQSTGAIRPISLEYEASAMAIPIRPTSVAANDNLPIIVWLLGESRAVPTNYYGLEINESLLDWFNPASSYNAVVSAAADEAGGQGFVTELVADASDYVGSLRADAVATYTLTQDESSSQHPIHWYVNSIGSWDGFTEVATKHLQLQDGVTMEAFLNCPGCYFTPESYSPENLEALGFDGDTADVIGLADDDPIHAVDLDAFKEELLEVVVQPVVDVADLLKKHNKITRLFTTMSADEMTVDPIFELNADLDDVSNFHTAVQEYVDQDQCTDDKWVVTLEDGTTVEGEGQTWPNTVGDTKLEANARIVRFAASGAGTVIDDVAADKKLHDEMMGITPPAEKEPTGNRDDTSTEGDGDSIEPDSDTDENVGAKADKDKQPATDNSGDSSTNDEDEDDTKLEGGGCSLSTTGPQPSAPFAWLLGIGLMGALFRRRQTSSTAPRSAP